MKNKLVLVIGALVLVVGGFFVATKLLESQKKEEIQLAVKSQSELLLRSTAMRQGNEMAPVTVVEFFDPECESCRAFHPLVKMLLKEFDGQIQVVYRYAAFHPNSKYAISILEAARRQDRYWDVLDVMYQYQPQWGDHHNPRPELLLGYLEPLKLDMEKLKADMSDPSINEYIAADARDGQTLGVRMTPSFFVNGEPLTSFGYEQLRQLIMKAIAQSGK